MLAIYQSNETKGCLELLTVFVGKWIAQMMMDSSTVLTKKAHKRWCVVRAKTIRRLGLRTGFPFTCHFLN